LATIYCIENRINNKKYIGKNASDNPGARWNHHKRHLNKGTHVNSYLQSAWNKYGEDNFRFSILEECESDRLADREIYWIKLFDTHGNGYNLTDGGEGTTGWTASDETRRKHRNRMLNITDETRHKLSESAKGNKHALGISHLYKKWKTASSSFYGVYASHKKWQARLPINKNYITIGTFIKEIDAARAYNKYVIENGLPNPLNF
jgi:group I intron endonuclease